MKTKHTPGPWRAAKVEGLAHWNISAGQLCLANVPNFIGSAVTMEHDGQGPANARLIAAAPELLEALKAILPIVHAFTQDELSVTTIDEAAEIMPRLCAAIAKAEGAT